MRLIYKGLANERALTRIVKTIWLLATFNESPIWDLLAALWGPSGPWGNLLLHEPFQHSCLNSCNLAYCKWNSTPTKKLIGTILQKLYLFWESVASLHITISPLDYLCVNICFSVNPEPGETGCSDVLGGHWPQFGTKLDFYTFFVPWFPRFSRFPRFSALGGEGSAKVVMRVCSKARDTSPLFPLPENLPQHPSERTPVFTFGVSPKLKIWNFYMALFQKEVQRPFPKIPQKQALLLGFMQVMPIFGLSSYMGAPIP